MIQTRPLFKIQVQVPSSMDLGHTPLGARRVAMVGTGSFEGDRVRGTVLPGPNGDWLLQRNDGVMVLDVRLTLETDDGAYIHMRYNGLRHGPADVMAKVARGEPVDPKSYYFRITPTFETSSEKYAWMNKILAVGIGERNASGPNYDIFEIL